MYIIYFFVIQLLIKFCYLIKYSEQCQTSTMDLFAKITSRQLFLQKAQFLSSEYDSVFHAGYHLCAVNEGKAILISWLCSTD